MIIIYGIKNCSTVKKALNWLTEQQIPAKIHDFRVDGLEPELLQSLVNAFGLEVLCNKKGMTWRNLDPQLKEDLDDTKLMALLQTYPAIIKRPIILQEQFKLIGFSEEAYQAAFK